MRVLAVSVGQPAGVTALDAHGREHIVVTGIYKAPVDGPVYVRSWGLENDGQADTRVIKGRQVHGGLDKAVYIYPAAHYSLWRAELSADAVPGYGHFGENLSVEGIHETTTRVGDTLAIGEVLLQVTTPRGPCYKLDIRMGIPEFRHRMTETGRTGFYCRVLTEGHVKAGDPVVLRSSDASAPTILEYHRANG